MREQHVRKCQGVNSQRKQKQNVQRGSERSRKNLWVTLCGPVMQCWRRSINHPYWPDQIFAYYLAMFKHKCPALCSQEMPLDLTSAQRLSTSLKIVERYSFVLKNEDKRKHLPDRKYQVVQLAKALKKKCIFLDRHWNWVLKFNLQSQQFHPRGSASVPAHYMAMPFASTVSSHR